MLSRVGHCLLWVLMGILLVSAQDVLVPGSTKTSIYPTNAPWATYGPQKTTRLVYDFPSMLCIFSHFFSFFFLFPMFFVCLQASLKTQIEGICKCVASVDMTEDQKTSNIVISVMFVYGKGSVVAVCSSCLFMYVDRCGKKKHPNVQSMLFYCLYSLLLLFFLPFSYIDAAGANPTRSFLDLKAAMSKETWFFGTAPAIDLYIYCVTTGWTANACSNNPVVESSAPNDKRSSDGLSIAAMIAIVVAVMFVFCVVYYIFCNRYHSIHQHVCKMHFFSSPSSKVHPRH